jgi:PAS domain S-box-containing protein
MQKIAEDFSLAFDQNPLPMLVTDRESQRIVLVNDAFLRQYGYDREDSAGLTMKSLRPPEELPLFRSNWRRFLRDSERGKPIYVGLIRHCRKDGSTLSVDVTASPYTYQGRPAVLSVAVDATARVRAEEEARQARERFEFIALAMNDTIWDLDLVSGEVWRSGNFGAVFGKAPGEVEPRMEGWSTLLHPDDRQRVLDTLHEVVRNGGKTWASEYRFRRTDGTWADKLDRAFVVHDVNGRAVRMVGSMIDISERKRVERELSDQRRRLMAIFDNAQEGIFISNDEDHFLDANPAACRIFGYSRDDLMTRTIWDLMPTELNAEYRERIQRLLVTGFQNGEALGRRRDGSLAEVEYRSVANIEPGVHLTVVRDITARKQADRALLAQKRRLQALFDNTQDAILLVNDQGRYLDANPAACALLGHTRDQLCTMTMFDLAPPEEGEKYRTLLRQLLVTGRQIGEARGRGSDGANVEVEFRAVANIEPGVHLAVVRDITQRKRDEASLRSLSGRLLRLQDEERRRLARELHDSTAQSLAALALELAVVGRSPLSPRGRSALGEAERLADQCARELRTLSYLLHPPLLDEMGLAAALRGYIDGFSKRSGVEVILDMPEDIQRLPREVETTLFRIVQESLTNVHRHAGSPTAHVRLALEPGAIRLEVADQGRGLVPHETNGTPDLEHDLGVGIAGMKERVRQLGGQLELDSTDTGVTVRATLPRSQP